jgi:WD40 repeat protein
MADTREAVAIIANLCREHGLEETLVALEREAGTLLQEGAESSDLAHKLSALKLSSRKEQAEELEDGDPLMMPTRGKLPTELERTIVGAHVGNVLCVSFCGTSRELVASGGADKMIALTDHASDEVLFRMADHKAPVLVVAAQPDGGSLLASTAMDGRVMLHDTSTRSVVGEWSCHTKYAVGASWRDRDSFASCSSDGLVAAFRRGAGESDEFEKVLELPLSREHGVTSVGWAAGAAAPPVLVASVQETHSLRYFDIAAQRLWSVTMNELGDEHVGFSAMHIAVHPSGKYLAVATDKQRTFVYEWGSRKRVRTLISEFKVDDFAPTPRQTWDAEGRHLLVAVGEMTVAVWDVGMERQVSQLSGHTAAVRGLQACDLAGSRKVATCSFDKTVRIWGDQPVSA